MSDLAWYKEHIRKREAGLLPAQRAIIWEFDGQRWIWWIPTDRPAYNWDDDWWFRFSDDGVQTPGDQFDWEEFLEGVNANPKLTAVFERL